MTGKRFWILNTLTKCSGIKDKDKLLTFDEVVDLLNDLSEENEQLKFELKECREHKLFSRRQLEEENEQLKSDLQKLQDSLWTTEKIRELEKENEQLKQRNDRQYNQLKQLWELIEKEDYNTLRSMLNQRETDEKLLQSEWRTYCD